MVKSIRYFLFVFSIIFLTIQLSCREDFQYKAFSGNLTFSKDTVFLDTIFSNISSSTYTLKVYNNSNEDLLIPSISLVNGNDSNYRINVDGQPGTNFENTTILAKDSLYVYVETTVDIDNTEQKTFLNSDAILFQNEAVQQRIPLISLIKDAVFLFPKTTNQKSIPHTNTVGIEVNLNAFYLTESQLRFSNMLPYVIYGYAIVPSGTTLHIEAGARLHFHNNSGIYVENGANINIEGRLSEDPELLEQEVILEGDRLEPEFSSIAGQWGGIIIENGSVNNTITHLNLLNATSGIQVSGNGKEPALTLSNSQIYNSLHHSLSATNTNIDAGNCVFGNSGISSVQLINGGKYDFIHCTIANYWTGGFRNTPTLLLSNFNNQDQNLLNASFTNCIVFGNRTNEIELLKTDDAAFDYSFSHCLLKLNKDDFNNTLYNFQNPTLFLKNNFNGDPLFTKPFDNIFNVEQNSSAINIGNSDQNTIYSKQDILGNNRNLPPDAGAFEYVFN